MSNLEQYYLKEEHQLFRKTLRDFLDKEVVPRVDKWEEDGFLPREIFKKFGDMGFFGISQEKEYQYQLRLPGPKVFKWEFHT